MGTAFDRTGLSPATKRADGAGRPRGARARARVPLGAGALETRVGRPICREQEVADAMELLYNSDNFAVLQIEVPEAAGQGVAGRGGFEIVDKFARKEIFLQGVVAERFQAGVQELVAQGPSVEALDDYIAGFTVLAQQPVVLH